jgi:hypothetical protein
MQAQLEIARLKLTQVGRKIERMPSRLGVEKQNPQSAGTECGKNGSKITTPERKETSDATK